MAESGDDGFDMLPAPSAEERKRIIEGIYNYCDRWYERCGFTDRCYRYSLEWRRTERHLFRREDPNDEGVIVQGVHEFFRQAASMLRNMAEDISYRDRRALLSTSSLQQFA